MAGKQTRALTSVEYNEIIKYMNIGVEGMFKPSPRITAALVVEANTGLRIGDVLRLTPNSFVKTEHGYRFNIKEQKTGKARSYMIPMPVYKMLSDYANLYGVGENDRYFPFTVRAVQTSLQNICGFLGINGIGTHSFRKMFATNCYRNSGNDIELTRRVLNHSSAAVTQRYLAVTEEKIEDVLKDIVNIPNLA